MMPPALLLMRFGQDRRFVLPLPIFLLWPLVLLAWLFLGLVWLITVGRPGGLRVGLLTLRLLVDLRGTEVDLRGQDGNFYLKFV